MSLGRAARAVEGETGVRGPAGGEDPEEEALIEETDSESADGRPMAD